MAANQQKLGLSLTEQINGLVLDKLNGRSMVNYVGFERLVQNGDLWVRFGVTDGPKSHRPRGSAGRSGSHKSSCAEKPYMKKVNGDTIYRRADEHTWAEGLRHGTALANGVSILVHGFEQKMCDETKGLQALWATPCPEPGFYAGTGAIFGLHVTAEFQGTYKDFVDRWRYMPKGVSIVNKNRGTKQGEIMFNDKAVIIHSVWLCCQNLPNRLQRWINDPTLLRTEAGANNLRIAGEQVPRGPGVSPEERFRMKKARTADRQVAQGERVSPAKEAS